MAISFRVLTLGSLLLFSISGRADELKAPPVAAPAFLQFVKFDVRFDGEDHPMVVVYAPGLLRIDEPKDGYSLIYDAPTQHYIGLEHRNYTYWEFSWATVRADVERSKRAEARLQDLNTSGMNDYSEAGMASTNAPALPSDSPSPTLPSGPGYVWKPSEEKKKIAGLDCTKWNGETPAGENIEAWCCAGLQPEIQEAMQRVRPVNEPIALVPVRVLVPPVVYGVFDALNKGGVTPVDITWGENDSKNRFLFTGTQQKPGKVALFTVPSIYNKTTLVTMDGLIDQKVRSEPKPSPPPIDLPTAPRVAP